jgi:hypothetical protein
VSDAPPPGGYQPPQPPTPPQPPPAPGYQPPTYQAPPAQPVYQQPAYQQPGQFQPVNPGASSSGNGCLKAFLIIGGISAVLGIIVVVFVVFVVGSAVNEVANSYGVANAADYEIKIDTCTVSEFGLVEATGTITNNKSERQAYSIDVDFFDPDTSNLKLGGSTDITSSINQGQSEAWSITSSSGAGDPPASVDCQVSEVSYWGI